MAADWPSLLAMCHPRSKDGSPVFGCPYDGLGCAYSECERNMRADSMKEFGCAKWINAECRESGL